MIAIVGAYIAGCCVQEITALKCRLLHTAMKDGNTGARQKTVTRTLNGKVNKWEYNAMVQTLWNGNAAALTASATSVAEERLVLMAMERQIALPR